MGVHSISSCENVVLNIKWISLFQKHFHVIFKGGALNLPHMGVHLECVCVYVCMYINKGNEG